MSEDKYVNLKRNGRTKIKLNKKHEIYKQTYYYSKNLKKSCQKVTIPQNFFTFPLKDRIQEIFDVKSYQTEINKKRQITRFYS